MKDLYGRVVQQYLPNFESGSGNTIFNPITSGDAGSTTTMYDAMDRPVHTSVEVIALGQDHSVDMIYSIDGEALKTRSEVVQSATADIITEEYKDINGWKTKTINFLITGGSSSELTTTFQYDGIGQLLSYTSDDGLLTTFDYDLAGRVKSRVHPDAGTENYTYDLLDHMVSKTRPNIAPAKIEYDYDALGRLLTVEYPEYSGGLSNVNNVINTYYPVTMGGMDNNRGRLMKSEDATGYQEFTYGNMGEVTHLNRTVQAPNGDIKKFNTEFNYDSWGRLIYMMYPDNEVVNQNYDLGGNLTSITGDNNYVAHIGYDHFEQKVFSELGNGTINTYAYEPDLRRLETLVTTSGGTISSELFHNDYSYDYVGNITNITNTASTQNGLGGGYSHTYVYDNLNRLLNGDGTWTGDPGQAQFGNNINAAYDLNMTYDNMHRIRRKEISGTLDNTSYSTEGILAEYHYFDTNHPRALSGKGHGPEMTLYTYDDNGNMISENGWGGDSKYMYWNEENLMKGIKVDDHIVQHYLYSSGERILKSKGSIDMVTVNGVGQEHATLDPYTMYPSGHITVSPTGRYTKHYYAGSERIVSRLAGTTDLFNGGTTNADLDESQNDGELEQLRISFGADVLTHHVPPAQVEDCMLYPVASEARRQCLCEHDPASCPADVLYYFHSDHLGSSSFLSDAAGDAYQFLLYLPWGESMAEQKVASFSTPYQFNGKERDEETGLYNYGARYYDPSLSVWLGVDPLADKFYSWSPYHYATNNPINIIDYDGRDTLPTTVADWKEVGSGILETVKEDSKKLWDSFTGLFDDKNETGAYFESESGRGENTSSTTAKNIVTIKNPGGARGIGTDDVSNVFTDIIDYFGDETMVANEGFFYWQEETIPDTDNAKVRVSKMEDSLFLQFKKYDNSWDTIIYKSQKPRGILKFYSETLKVKDTRSK